MYLIPAVLWSLSDFLLRSDALHINQTVLVKVIICMCFWMVIQYHYILSSYHGRSGRIPFAFLPLLAVIVLAAVDLIIRLLASLPAMKFAVTRWITIAMAPLMKAAALNRLSAHLVSVVATATVADSTSSDLRVAIAVRG